MSEARVKTSEAGPEYTAFPTVRIAVGATQSLAATATAADSAAVADGGPVRVIANVAIHYGVGASATTSDAYLPAGMAEYVHLDPGETLSVIKASGENDGSAWVSEPTMEG